MNFDKFVKTELSKLTPKAGDVFILNIDSDDPDVLYSDEILDSVELLSETLEDITGVPSPVLVFGSEVSFTLLNREQRLSLIKHLQEIDNNITNGNIKNIDDDDDDLTYDNNKLKKKYL